jgi:uncharacterized OB-fold protein
MGQVGRRGPDRPSNTPSVLIWRMRPARAQAGYGMPPSTIRTLPVLTSLNRFFWTAGRHGRLAILRCESCDAWLHPPSPICPHCLSRRLTPRDVSGLATIETFTINHQAWRPELPVPYVIAVVSLDESPALRLTTNLVGDDALAARIGGRVRVVFEPHEDVWLPMFTLV